MSYINLSVSALRVAFLWNSAPGQQAYSSSRLPQDMELPDRSAKAGGPVAPPDPQILRPTAQVPGPFRDSLWLAHPIACSRERSLLAQNSARGCGGRHADACGQREGMPCFEAVCSASQRLCGRTGRGSVPARSGAVAGRRVSYSEQAVAETTAGPSGHGRAGLEGLEGAQGEAGEAPRAALGLSICSLRRVSASRCATGALPLPTVNSAGSGK